MKKTKLTQIASLASVLLLILLMLSSSRESNTEATEIAPLAFQEMLPTADQQLLPNQHVESSALIAYDLKERGLPASIDCLMIHEVQGKPPQKPLFVLHSDLENVSGLLSCKQRVRVPEEGKLIFIASLRYAKDTESAAT